MDLENLTYPAGYSQPSKPQVEVFETWVWKNSELCKECFTQVRTIGPEIMVDNSIHNLRINEWYERTESGSQEHTPFTETTERYGETFCENCGSNLSNLNEDWSLDEMKARAKNILRYFNTSDEPPYTIKGKVMGETLKDLKQVPENQGFDTEIIAVATIRALN